ncbi:MKRN2 opposite strand protein MKRN2 antisense RNA 1 MKRN2 antisense gene protein 1 [Larimichthys crocea]|uniref:MKRN2 opposite strand protein MKRN2 antisense RNA 1 MKRN2 antisense gene protein 1 n=1 Tax=Larimichthys crocea TaxID=215358 RepID=A0A6G0J5Z8_LARCR|nr:MKRN2 opposite strand protein MKRN2 antisense RNA 1 MKRN2 antisense gene protein 1 [Larimichthys crocea]
MEMDQSIIRLTHCEKEIFCFSVPDECPSCGEELKGSRLQEAPVSLPSPLTNGHKSSCCLLVAPAHDNFNRDFDGTSDLHTGISNTTGVVYNYTRGGVRQDHSGWERCVSVPLVRPDMFHLLAQWDQYLDRFSDGPMWDPAWHRFHDDDHNCFTFCLLFINGVLAAEGRSSLSRDAFTSTFILPRMRRVSKYSTLYRHIQRDKYYMVDRQEDREED